MSFTKYEQYGAYHWRTLAARKPTTYSARIHALYGWFLKEAGERSPDLVVDVGCGDAAMTHLLAERTGARVVGIEPEPDGVELAKKALRQSGSRAEVIRGRGEELPFPDGSVSLVVLCEVVEHLEDVRPLLHEAARALSAEGTVLISTPQWQSDALRPYHVHEFTALELRSVCERFFRSVDVQVSEPPILYDRYMSSRVARATLNVLSLAGLNPFSLRRPAVERRTNWRQLLAVATGSRLSSAT